MPTTYTTTQAAMRRLNRQLELAMADVLADYPEASACDAHHDMVQAVAISSGEARVAVVEWCTSQGVAVPASLRPAPAPTRAQREAAERARRDAMLTDPANAAALARIRARRDRVRGLARGRVQ